MMGVRMACHAALFLHVLHFTCTFILRRESPIPMRPNLRGHGREGGSVDLRRG